MLRIAFYGGSFNPPHVGHMMVASWVLWADLADEVHICPVADHPFGKDLLPFQERMALCGAMKEDMHDNRIHINPIERTMPPGANYTYDTLQALREQNPDRVIRPLMGSDILTSAHKWKAWDELVQKFPPIFVGREGYPAQDSPTFPNISSTEVRDQLGRGEIPSGRLSRSVLEYIRKHGLYR